MKVINANELKQINGGWAFLIPLAKGVAVVATALVTTAAAVDTISHAKKSYDECMADPDCK